MLTIEQENYYSRNKKKPYEKKNPARKNVKNNSDS